VGTALQGKSGKNLDDLTHLTGKHSFIQPVIACVCCSLPPHRLRGVSQQPDHLEIPAEIDKLQVAMMVPYYCEHYFAFSFIAMWMRTALGALDHNLSRDPSQAVTRTGAYRFKTNVSRSPDC
jgi:hypothetical protein